MLRTLSLMLTLLCLAPSVLALNAEEVYRKASPAVMTLYVRDRENNVVGNGTAFLISPDGLAVTAYHVVSGAEKAAVKFADGTEAEVKGVMDGNQQSDVALIRIGVKNRPFLRMAGLVPPVGSEAFVIGAPKGLEFSITQGIVNRLGEDEGTKVIQFSAPVSPGNSGSPLLNASAEVIGVVSYQRTDGQNLNFAAPTSYITDLNFAAQAKPLPLPVARRPESDLVTDWKTVNFAGTGLELKLPEAPGVVDAELSQDLKDVATEFRSSRITIGETRVGITFFDFKAGCCPTARDVADEVLKERKSDAAQLGSQASQPQLAKIRVPGADESHSVVATVDNAGEKLIECTVVTRKQNRLWMVVLRFSTEDSSGKKHVSAILNSLRIRSR